MSDLPHLRIEGTEQASSYTSVVSGHGGVFQLPARNKPAHARKLRSELEGAGAEAQRKRAAEKVAYSELVKWQADGVVLTFKSDPNHELKLESLERRKDGILLLSLSEKDDCQFAKVFVPEQKLTAFLRVVDKYAANVVLTYATDQKNVASIKAVEDHAKGIKLYGGVREKDGVAKLSFIMPEGEAANFEARIGALATLQSTSRQNDKLVGSITAVRLALIEDFWQDRLPFPPADKEMWWEIWLRGRRENATAVHGRFVDIAKIVGITRISDRHVAFPERIVVHAFATAKRLSDSIDLLALLAELRQAKELASYFIDLPPKDQADKVREAARRLIPPGKDAASVCILDWGVNRGHPLLAPVLAEADMHAVNQAWGVSDSDPRQHGTGMAGIATYGCLTEILGKTGPINVRHKLESVKILPPPPATNDPPDYGRIMQDGVARAHIQAPQRNRVVCMAVTADDRDLGMPTLWSGAVDDMTAGVLDNAPKLMFISAGNVRHEFHQADYSYHTWNITKAGIEDPAQAWNALTVGAITDKVQIQDPALDGWQPIAEAGDLCPTARTSLAWPADNHKGWPIKPDIVMEGGNYAFHGNDRSGADDLSLLTTFLDNTGRLIDSTRDTSPATAAAARLAAILWSHYPRFRPETVRALMVHSSTWTPKMLERFPGGQKATIQRLLRCYGYGVPNLHRALNSAENIVNLIFEGELHPFMKTGGEVKTHEMHVHSLPWPTEVLEGLGETIVTMRVTLSYFIEPSPNSIGWETNHRYASHGLRFDVIRLPGESLAEFKRRISRTEWENPNQRPTNVPDNRNWVIGEHGRTHGSLHCDWWEGKAVELARCNKIAVYPVTGWWRERQHLGRYSQKARYSLVVSIEAPRVNVDLYNPITNYNTVQTELMA